jgi:hypothetical protein
LAGVALGTALLTKEKNVGVDELTSGAGGVASVCPDVFVVRCFGGGRDECVRINGDDGDVLARLTFIKSGCDTSETSSSTLCASITDSLLIKVGEAILDTFVGL